MQHYSWFEGKSSFPRREKNRARRALGKVKKEEKKPGQPHIIKTPWVGITIKNSPYGFLIYDSYDNIIVIYSY